MKKLLLLAAVAAGAVVVAKSKSDQLKGAAAKVTGDPRVQSALATATEKAAPYVSQVQEKAAPVVSQVGDKVSTATTAAGSFAADKLGRASDSSQPATDNLESVPSEAVAEVSTQDPVSAPDFEAEATSAPIPDPLTDPLVPSDEPGEGSAG